MKTCTSRPFKESVSNPPSASVSVHRASAVMGLREASPRPRPDVSHFDQLPDAALIAVQALAVVVGKGVSSIWRDIKTDADFPKPIRLSAGCTRFRVGDIRAYLASKALATAQPKRARAGRAG